MYAKASQPQTSNNDLTQPISPPPRDSMVTVRLSEPPTPQRLTQPQYSPIPNNGRLREVEIPRTSRAGYKSVDGRSRSTSPHPNTFKGANGIMIETTGGPTPEQMEARRRGSHGSNSSEETQVNWEQLEKTEELEPRDQDSEDVGCTCKTLRA